MKITAFILLFLFFLLATESKTSNRDKPGRKDKGNHGKDRGQGHHKDSESRTNALSPPASGQLIRLAGDDGFPRKYFEGRVEVYVGEKWGIVCDDNWDIEDAHVACRQLGFVSGAQEAVHSAGFGTGSWDNNSILMDDVSCQGDEATISGCSRQLHHDCTQQEAAGVRCVENSGCLDDWIAGTSGCYKLSSETVNTRDLAVDRCTENGGHLLTIETERENNFISNVLYALGDKEFSGSVLTGGMRRDNVWVWQKVTWSLSPPADEDISFMNLEDFDLYAFDFGDLFRSTRINRASKEKVRPMQGVNRRKKYSEMIERTSSTSISYFKWFPGWMPHHVRAEPSNKKYDECIFLEKDYEFINGSKVDVGYYFWKDEYCNTTRTFMPNGFHYMCEIEKKQLRVPECYVGNGADYRGNVSTTQQGSVCLKWNDPASTIVNPETHPGKGLGDHSYCRNPDDKQRPWCWVSHIEKKFGFCYVAECGKKRTQRAPRTTDTTTDMTIQLVGGATPDEGRVEVIINGKRGTVCDDGWNTNAANVTCKSLGYVYGLPLTNAHFGAGSGPIWFDDVSCTGREKTLGECQMTLWGEHDCSHTDDAGVKCISEKPACGNDSYQCPDGGCVPLTKVCTGECHCTNCEDEADCNVTIQLVGGATLNEGRVEVIINGIRGTVCDDGWNATAANVTCKSLGYVHGVPLTIAHFGEGSGPIWFDDVSCTGREKTLGECQMNLRGQHNCLHKEDAGVKCSPEKTACGNVSYQCPDGGCVPLTNVCTGECHCTNCEDEADCNVTIQLVGGATLNEGRVEVIINGIRGTVCDDGWNATAANVTCKSLGYV